MTTRQYGWTLVGLLWAIALLNYIDRQVVFSLFPLLRSELRLSSVQLGLLSTVFLWIYGVLSPFAGYAADRFGRGRTIAISLVFFSAVTLATGASRTFGQLISARALMGISEACYLPAALAMIAEYHGSRTRSLAVGIHQSGLYAGTIAGGAFGGWAGERYGWRMPFFALGAVGMAYGMATLPFFRRAAAPAKAEAAVRVDFREAVLELARLPGFGTLTGVFSAVGIANWLVYTWLPLYLYERFGMSLAEAAFTATFYLQAASAGGIILGGWLADRWSGATSLGRLYTQIFGVLLAGPFLFLMGHSGSRAWLVAALVVFGVGRGFYDCNTMPVLCQIARDDLRSTGYGIFNFGSCVAGGLAAALAGALKGRLGLAGAFEIAAGILFISGTMLFRVRGTIRGR
jgi:MFS family permease